MTKLFNPFHLFNDTVAFTYKRMFAPCGSLYYPKPSVTLGSLKFLSTGVIAALLAHSQVNSLTNFFGSISGEVQGYVELPVPPQLVDPSLIRPQVVVNLHERVESLLPTET
jgi:hypothetical protein